MKTILFLSFFLYFHTQFYSQKPCRFTLEDSLVKEGTYIMTEVYYDLGKPVLRPEAFPELDKLYSFLKKNPNLVVEVGGNISYNPSMGQMCSGPLSEGRARSIVDYLISKGISRERLVAKGYEFRRPFEEKDSNCKPTVIYNEQYINKLKTEEEKEIARMKNRRIEIKIIRNDYSPNPMIEGK
jgi:outer membrane protein OmpA-like peptidoglycan-associated protein